MMIMMITYILLIARIAPLHSRWHAPRSAVAEMQKMESQELKKLRPLRYRSSSISNYRFNQDGKT